MYTVNPCTYICYFLLQTASCLTLLRIAGHRCQLAQSLQFASWGRVSGGLCHFPLCGDIAMTGRSARQTDSTTQRSGKASFGSAVSPTPLCLSLFFEEIPSASHSLSFPSLLWCWPLPKALGCRWGVAGEEMEGPRGGGARILWLPSRGLQGVVSIESQQQEPTEWSLLKPFSSEDFLYTFKLPVTLLCWAARNNEGEGWTGPHPRGQSERLTQKLPRLMWTFLN